MATASWQRHYPNAILTAAKASRASSRKKWRCLRARPVRADGRPRKRRSRRRHRHPEDATARVQEACQRPSVGTTANRPRHRRALDRYWSARSTGRPRVVAAGRTGIAGTVDADPRLVGHHRLAAVRAHLLEMAGDIAVARAANWRRRSPPSTPPTPEGGRGPRGEPPTAKRDATFVRRGTHYLDVMR
jgi:hypothetical protein